MELLKQARARARAERPPVPGSGAASRVPTPAGPNSASHATFYPADSLGVRVPTSAYLIVPLGGQPGAPGTDAPHVPGPRPVSRVSLRPPPQVLSGLPALPGAPSPQPSPPAVGKRMASSSHKEKVQRLKSVPSQASKRSVQQEPQLKEYPQMSEAVRAKFRDALTAALCVDSDDQGVQESAPNVSPVGSDCENGHADDTATGPKFAGGSITKQDNMFSNSILGSNLIIKVSKDAHQQPLESDVSGNSTVFSDNRLVWAPDIVAGPSEPVSHLNSKRTKASDTDARHTLSLNEPEFKRTKTSDGTGITWAKEGMIQKAQTLALRIEEELFKLFGGVNKKYKEKGRSLLFNLKDKNNPVLRERVLSGEITPKCLCSMSTEDLASEELSAWRLAKAEELAKMVVLPNEEVHARRFLRKTHKGEFHVEVEQTGGISIETELQGDLLSHISWNSIECQTGPNDRARRHTEYNESYNTVQAGVTGKAKSSFSSNLECPMNKKTGLIQEHLVDALKDTDNDADDKSMDEFMEAPDSDLPIENHYTEQDDPGFIDKAYMMLKPEKNHITEDSAVPPEFEFTCDAPSSQVNCQVKIGSPKNGSIPNLGQAKQPQGGLLIKSSHERMDAEKLDTSSASVFGSTMQPKAHNATLAHGSLWEGTIQLTLSSLTNVVAIFKSGEKPSTNGWRRFVEIKGRVRLPIFQEYLEQLPNSRSRALMVTELRWKEGSGESGRRHFLQIIDSYIADERVGIVKPTEGVEIYICPSQGKAAHILAEHLPKEHSGSLTVTGESAIGVVVWRRPRVSTGMPTGNDHSKRQSMPISRKQHVKIASSVPMPSQLAKPPPANFGYSSEHPHLEYEPAGGVPPGLGQVVNKDEEDLPEYNFVSSPNTPANLATSQAYRHQQHVESISPPMDQVIRQLVRKYGDGHASGQPWDCNQFIRHLVHKYGNGHASSQPRDCDPFIRHLVQKCGNGYASAQHWDGHASSQPWESDPVIRNLVHKYGDGYASAQHWDNDYYHDDFPEWDPIQSAHHHNAMQQEHMMVTPHPRSPSSSQVYILRQQHAMTVHHTRDYQHMFQPAGARSRRLGRRSGAQWQDGVPQPACFFEEPDMVAPELMPFGPREPWLGRWRTY